ncbi:hypothetical protein EDD21DRAFT_449445 [Dissophora ornata]|nr:hypothetical protein EDD21DRAFT_449445 [Dissophora ornata]
MAPGRSQQWFLLVYPRVCIRTLFSRIDLHVRLSTVAAPIESSRDSPQQLMPHHHSNDLTLVHPPYILYSRRIPIPIIFIFIFITIIPLHCPSSSLFISYIFFTSTHIPENIFK